VWVKGGGGRSLPSFQVYSHVYVTNSCNVPDCCHAHVIKYSFLQAATQDAIDLEANLSRLLERAEAEKAELGERTTPADQARLAAAEAALLQGQKRARELEVELGIAQRNADFRMQWLQVWPSFPCFLCFYSAFDFAQPRSFTEASSYLRQVTGLADLPASGCSFIRYGPGSSSFLLSSFQFSFQNSQFFCVSKQQPLYDALQVEKCDCSRANIPILSLPHTRMMEEGKEGIETKIYCTSDQT
jgi:hypothetical protein